MARGSHHWRHWVEACLPAIVYGSSPVATMCSMAVIRHGVMDMACSVYPTISITASRLRVPSSRIGDEMCPLVRVAARVVRSFNGGAKVLGELRLSRSPSLGVEGVQQRSTLILSGRFWHVVFCQLPLDVILAYHDNRIRVLSLLPLPITVMWLPVLSQQSLTTDES